MKQLCNSYLLRILPFKTLVCARMLSCVWLGATPWTGAPQAPLSMGFSSQEDWSGSPLPFHTVPWKDWCCSWSSSTLATWCKELTHLKIPWCWERLKADGEGDVRGWDGWMASPTWWIWVWTNSRSWWWTGKPDVLQCMGLQRIRHDWAAELNWTEQPFPTPGDIPNLGIELKSLASPVLAGRFFTTAPLGNSLKALEALRINVFIIGKKLPPVRGQCLPSARYVSSRA